MGGCQSSPPNPMGEITGLPLMRCFSGSSRCPLILWLNSLDDIETCRLAGVILSCVATVLATVAISTEFWVKRFGRGVFVFRGLWKDCQMGSCARPAKVPLYLVVSIVLILISLLTSYGSVISGTLSLTPFPPPKKILWAWLTTSLSVVSGVTGGMGLIIFMHFATKESNAYLSWSLVPGWFSILAVSIAGVCHFEANRWNRRCSPERCAPAGFS